MMAKQKLKTAVKRVLKRKRRGSILALAVVIMLILLATGTGLLSLGYNSRLRGIRHIAEIRARAAADAGLTKALYLMNQQLAAGTLLTSDLPGESNITLESCDSAFTYTVTGDASTGYFIQCTGTSGRVSKQITTSLRLYSPFDSAIFAKEGIKLRSNATIDQYNNDPEDGNLQFGTNSIASGAIELANGTVINADILIGPGGDPAYVIKDLGATITGEISTLPSEDTLDPIILPAWVQALSSEGSLETPQTITTSERYDNINLESGGTVTVSGDVTLYITDGIVLGNTAQIQLDNTNPDSSLTIYLGGNLEGKVGSCFNNLTADPTKFKIYGLNSCQNIVLKNSSELYAAIYAPEAMVNFGNSADTYGSVIAKDFDQGNAANFHYDAALKNATLADRAVTFRLSHWQEN